MRRALVLGGYGGFGLGVSERLAADGFEVLVAGRSLARATAACGGRPGLVPLAVDRDGALAQALGEHSPWAVVDAAGPFQGLDYRVARACIAAGVHYLDIADGRAFVAGIGALDAEARAAGISVISGASSVPALSGAAVRALAAGMDEVRAVEMAISASNRASAGRSVTRAILSYVGRPIALWRGGAWRTGFGWGELRRQGYAVQGRAPIRPRLVGLADVPDLELLPGRLPGRPAVSFRAGTELDGANLLLWLLGRLVRWKLLAGLGPLEPPIRAAQRLTRGLGSERSAMTVALWGMAGGCPVERRWTLVAEEGCGPQIPCLAAPLLLARLRDGALEPGARDAGELLDLAGFDVVLDAMPTARGRTETPLEPPLYARVMGERFAALPPAVRRMHEVLRDGGAAGRADVTRGQGWAARLVARLFGFPPAGRDIPVQVAFAEADGVETWTRDFGGRRFSSRLSRRGALLVERFGPLRFGFDLPGGPDGLSMRLVRWWLGPVPLPPALAPRSEAREWEEDGRFHFDVPIALPLAGLVVHYRGWLEPKADGCSTQPRSAAATPR
jgi:NAD(P)-dependent dehydrogenase (short-subunit alcohol dehydrogenase family)